MPDDTGSFDASMVSELAGIVAKETKGDETPTIEDLEKHMSDEKDLEEKEEEPDSEEIEEIEEVKEEESPQPDEVKDDDTGKEGEAEEEDSGESTEEDGETEEVDSDSEEVREEKAEVVEEDAQTNRIKQLEEEHKTLLSMINSQGIVVPSADLQVPEQTQQAAEVPKTDTPVKTVQPQIVHPESKLTNEEFEDIISNKDNFTSFINDVVQKTRQQSMIDSSAITRQLMVADRAVETFFMKDENKVLLPVKNLVERMAAEIEKQNPSKGIHEVLEDAAKELKKQLPLIAQQQAAGGEGLISRDGRKPRHRKGKRNKKPGFARTGSSRKARVKPQKEDKNSVQSQIEELSM